MGLRPVLSLMNRQTIWWPGDAREGFPRMAKKRRDRHIIVAPGRCGAVLRNLCFSPREISMAQTVVVEQSSMEKFAELAASHRLRVFRFALGSLRNRDAAEDVTQDCLLRAHLAWERFRGDCSPQTWLIGIANNLIRDARSRPPDRFKNDQFRNGVLRSPSAHMDSSIRDPRQLTRGMAYGKTGRKARVAGHGRGPLSQPAQDLLFALYEGKEFCRNRGDYRH